MADEVRSLRDQLDKMDKEFDQSGKVPSHLTVTSPISGIVIRKDIFEGGGRSALIACRHPAPSAQHVVGVGHDLDTGAVQVRMQVAGGQEHGLARGQLVVLHQQRALQAGGHLTGEAAGEAEVRGVYGEFRQLLQIAGHARRLGDGRRWLPLPHGQRWCWAKSWAERRWARSICWS